MALSLASPLVAEGRVTDFFERHSGLSISGGQLFRGFGHEDFDPVPELAPVGTTIAGSANTKIYPLKIGFFRDQVRVGVDAFAIVLISRPSTWTATGVDGAGSSLESGWGAGVNFAVHYAVWSRFRLSQRLEVQTFTNNLRLTFTQTGGVPEIVDLTARAIRFGTAAQAEFWLGDMWTLSIAGGYHRGLPTGWNVATAGTLFGVAQAAGAALNGQDGTQVKSDFGGFYAEAGLKLAFF